MGDFKALNNVLFDQKESNALPIDAPDQGKEFLDEKRRKTKRRFVKDEQNRFGHQAPSDCQHLLLAARKAAGALRLSLCESRENAEDLLPILLAGDCVLSGILQDRDCLLRSSWEKRSALPARE